MRDTSKKSFKDTNFYKEIIKLRDEMKPMSWKDRVDHIWTYYKEYIGVFAIFAFVMTGLIASSIQAQRETVITGMMVNITIDQAGFNYLSEDYEEKLGLNKNQQVALEYTSFANISTSVDEADYYAAMTVVAEVAAEQLDYIILDKLGMEFYAGQEVYMDLSKVFTEEELADFAERDLLIYCMEEEEQIPWPAAIKINDLAYIKDNVTSAGDIYFALGGSSKKYEEIRAVWEYIKAWEPKNQQ